ncbi:MULTISPECIES: methyl-accepting chemotaxis protein [unclassified Aureimonas]|uniref:methyl-accepting chemotaxis protein n=1 Tax=unclassified Aureimonas TaxID=2615206 RepID=UPI0006F86616|nr:MULTISPECIES: PAS domain-containing methyl-accepting chemotaxis protein [unclassified Aureimonas]KQT64046.1 chemotaxis protein [Aureimonas sp. Leaf427]KQT81238.1 chemotaxis protein [Aureimonas sp. Leaf460]
MVNFLSSNADRILAALDKSMAIIEFDLSGKILSANVNFCELMEYKPQEIIGQHHRIFVEPDHARSAEYAAFWAKLARGEFECDEFKRIGKNGKEVFIRGNYNPILNGNGKPLKVVKFCNDITATKLSQMENSAKMAAIDRAQAIIEFDIDGTIRTANPNFLSALGYTLSEVIGRHHSIFVEPAFVKSPDYQAFWTKLRAGEFVADEFTRIGKDGRPVYIQASYNPIFDFNGRIVKVVKFATDVTGRVVAVRRLGAALGALAEGDLGSGIDEAFASGLDPIRQSFNTSVETLQGAMKVVRHNADVIQSGSEHIRAASDDLARRTEQQAAAIEETSAALAEMTTSVRLSSRRADEVGDLVSRTKAEAEQSGSIVTKAVEAMGKIEESSDRIGNIIGVIDEIAFQTNLLALNAGVEAARAGEAGRGFAVVAQEVRGLAQRSAEAAKEIKSLISTSRHQVEEGVEFVGRAGESLQGIVDKVAEIDTHVHAIVASARSQASGLSEINVAVGTLDKGTQQNAAMVEESTAACNELSAEVNSLNKLLGQFKIDGAERTRNVPPRHATSPVHDLHSRVARAF